MHRITLLADGRTFTVTEGQTILQAALAAGVELPRRCRNGSCRACRCVVQHGSVRHLVPWPGLSRDELAEGWVLPCVGEPASDLVLEVPDVPR